jgi:acyl carrier protein phosphodiesterase
MNFLGHCLFSDTTPSALAGSLWPDFAKKPTSADCSETFLYHFDQHQRIDRITDNSDVLAPLRNQLRPVFRKTTPIIIDMMLDHHLAIHWQRYHSLTLEDFAQKTYRNIAAFTEITMPERLERTIQAMTEHNWFVTYRSKNGMQRAMTGVAKRIRFSNPIALNAHLAVAWTYEFETVLHNHIQDVEKARKPQPLHISTDRRK